MQNALTASQFTFANQVSFYRGKVRDVYRVAATEGGQHEQLIMIASDRISAFDHVLPRAIPFKGQVLNQIAAYFLQATRDVCPNWLLETPDPNVAIGHACTPYRVEMVIRGYLTGHAWRTYQSGKRELCGVTLPEGLRENDRFPTPIITPTTKAEEGHDEDISRAQIIAQGIVTEAEYRQLEAYTHALFERGTAMARAHRLILVDTKYEFGKLNDQIMLIDEIHTPDSSRYFYAEGYEERQIKGAKQRQLSKEFVREWLMANGFQGKDGQEMPTMPDEFVTAISDRYIELFEKVTGMNFEKANTNNITIRIQENLKKYF